MTRKTKLATLAAALFAAPLFAEEPKAAAPPARPEPAEVRLVYPASATSKEPIVCDPRDAARPKTESRETPFGQDVETPIGQVRAVLETLEELRRTQRVLIEKLDALSAAPAPALDPGFLAEPLERLGSRLDGRVAEAETSLAERFGQETDALNARLDAILEAAQAVPPPSTPPGWTLVRVLALAACCAVLGSLVARGALALWRAAVERREALWAERLAAYESAQNAAKTSKKPSSAQ